MNLFCGHSVPYSQTWPASGSMRNGVCSERPPLALPTSVSGSSSSPGLPTPRARDARGKGFEDALPNVVRLLPTPTVQEANGTGPPDSPRNDTLRAQVALLPTPTATPYGNNQSPSAGAAVRPSLDSLVPTFLPTPRATDGTKGGPNQRGSSGDLMLPSAVAHMSDGASTSPPSDGGNTSSDDRPRPQPMLWDD